MGLSKALIVFCEGAHDVAFVKQVLKFCFKAKTTVGKEGTGWKFSEYPSPFNSLFQTNVTKHAAKDLSLDMAHKFFLPDKTMEKDDWVILLFNAGGSSQIEKVKILLKDFIPLQKRSSVFSEETDNYISEVKYLFIYDADHKTPDNIAVWMQSEFSSIEDTEWTINEWNIEGNQRGVIQDDKALYIWAGEDNKGTLEDIILPIYKDADSALIKKSTEFIDGTFIWDEGVNDDSKKYSSRAKKAKAIICTAGQGKKPGRPLSAIISDNALAKENNIINSPQVKQFSDFLADFTLIKTHDRSDESSL
jgi:Protein of unknown function (DUF3226)